MQRSRKRAASAGFLEAVRERSMHPSGASGREMEAIGVVDVHEKPGITRRRGAMP
ncbi:MAG: hypothetical protein JWO56_431 [Acidobacteria bacterium]|nr:hypothetical protein [Acidobacteriota bacterium]